METTDLTIGAAADNLQGLQITSENQVPTESESKDLNVTTTKEFSIDTNRNPSANSRANSISNHTTNGSPACAAGGGITEPTTNGHSVAGAIDNDASSANGEAKTTNIPNIQINGIPEAEYVNKDIMGPEDEEDGGIPVPPESGNVNVGQKKRKSKKKPKSKRGLNAPTGFEEFYVDAPLTPVEHEEERGIYHNSVPFHERIEIAIQRFFAKRNLNSERKDAFDKYLAYGGVDSGPKMFGGLDSKTLSDLTAPEIATMTAKHSVGEDKDDSADSMYTVDFEGVAKAFLSTQLPIVCDLWNEEAIKIRVGVIRNFLNYLLHHDVCPEYNTQVHAARDTCDLAEKELWLIVQSSRLLPGEFNTACSELFGGSLQGLYIGDQDWAKGFVSDGIGISAQMAHKAFKTGLVARADEESLGLFKKQDDANKIKVMTQIETGLEVTDLILAEEEVLELYQSPYGKDLKPLGRMRARAWYFPRAPEEDLTEEEEIAAKHMTKDIKEYEFWVEDEVLKKCFVGMKFITVVKELSFGVLYFDTLLGVFCSFCEVLPNEEMIGWREPETTWLPMREKIDLEGNSDDDEDGTTVENPANEDGITGGVAATRDD